jgi:hypothetical protein
MPDETGETAFVDAREEKLRKYQPVKTWLEEEASYQSMPLYIVGALDSWDSPNDEILKQLRIGNSYAKLFRKLCTTKAIRASTIILKSCRSSSGS